MPQISVIVPVYKVEPYLRRCVDSILAQTFTDFELILVDDGSPDGCPAICDEYAEKDSRVVVIHQENGGVSRARNAGIDAARGEYLFFVDSDDWIEPEHIEVLLPTEDEDLVYGGKKYIYHNSVQRTDSIPNMIIDSNNLDTYKKLIVSGIYEIISITPCYKLSIIRDNSIRMDERISFAEDAIFNLSVLTHCKCIRYETKCTYCYRIDNIISASHHLHKNRLEAEIKKSMLKELFLSNNDYSVRWSHWQSAIIHYCVWKKIGTIEEQKAAIRLEKETFEHPYFRECIPYMRKNGTLDQRIETYFMRYWLHTLYKPFFGIVTIISKLKNKLVRK